jgi:hypothetical protein
MKLFREHFLNQNNDMESFIGGGNPTTRRKPRLDILNECEYKTKTETKHSMSINWLHHC